MTRKEIISQLVKRTDLTTSQASHAVEGIIDIVADALVSCQSITLRGFGAIKVVTRAAKPVRNISKGVTFTIPERKRVKFVAYNELQQRINDCGNGIQPANNKAW